MPTHDELRKIYKVSNIQELMDKLGVRYESDQYWFGEKGFKVLDEALTHAHNAYDSENSVTSDNDVTQMGIDTSAMFEKSSVLFGGDYKTGVIISMIVSFVGWLVCAGAVILVVVAFEKLERMGAVAIGPGVGVFIGGLLLVISGQATRALFDSTNYTRQMLELAKQEKSSN